MQKKVNPSEALRLQTVGCSVQSIYQKIILQKQLKETEFLQQILIFNPSTKPFSCKNIRIRKFEF